MIAAVVAAACGRAAPPPPPERGRPVAVAAVERGALEALVEAVGEARPVRDAGLSAEGVGRVEWIAEEGARLRAGEVVARLSADRSGAASEAAEARRAQAEAELAQRLRDLERAERLLAAGVASRQEAEAARTAAEAAEAAAAAARAAAREAASADADRTVRAPFDGVLLEKRVERGEVVAPGAPVARFGDISVLEVAAFVGEADAVRIREDARAVVRFDARPDEAHAGSVHRIDRALAPGARTAEAVVRLANPDGRLPAGLLARVRITAERHAEALSIPLEALRTGPDGDAVWTAEAGRARRRAVRTGLRGAEAVEVLEGLAAGESVVVRGGEEIAEGDLLEVPAP